MDEPERIENERVEKGQLIAPSEKDQNKASSKLANMFNTNRQYINDPNQPTLLALYRVFGGLLQYI